MSFRFKTSTVMLCLFSVYNYLLFFSCVKLCMFENIDRFPNAS